MYIPKHFEQNDRQKIIAFMRQYNFAVMISVKEGLPIGTHLPFVIEERGSDIVLVSHMSRANEQWKTLEAKEVLVIFHEPHAYISPSLYEKPENVPTWNYIAVHAYGDVVLIHDADKETELLEKMMLSFEPAYLEQWKTLDPAYKNNLRKGIVAFEVTVKKIQGKEKLSQNKTDNERQNVIRHLEESNDPLKSSLTNWMRDKSHP